VHAILFHLPSSKGHMSMKTKKLVNNTSKEHVIPLYNRIESLMRSKILSGQYEPNEKLPTEEELVQEFGVSKITIRNAMGRLEAQGLIVRNRGKGTFVARKVPVAKQFTVASCIEDIVLSAERYEARPLSIQTVKVAETRVARTIRDNFKLSNEDEIVLIRRIRFLDDVPIYFLENFMPIKIGRYLTMEELSTKPLLRVLKEKVGLTIVRGQMFLEACPADHDIAELLECQTFDPLMLMQVHYWLPDDEPCEVVNCFVKADYFKYKVDLDMEGVRNL
jgi:GntR family transcriptional regulator